jgi:tellurite resistance protein TehA-like permease
MANNWLKIFRSEWFGVPIATFALAQIYILLYQSFHNLLFLYIGQIFSIFGLALFILIMALWIIRYLVIKDKKIQRHWDNLTSLSFIALIPIIGFVANAQLWYLFGVSNITFINLSLLNFFFEYALALILGVLLGYRLYTKEISPKEINYALVIPPLAIGTSIFLGLDLATYFTSTIAMSIYFLTVIGLGMFFFLYIFIGSLALSGHTGKNMHELLPVTMLPVGIASLIVINLISLMKLNSINYFYLSPSFVSIAAMALWGFELWNFMVVGLIALTKSAKGLLSVWAYAFPLGLFAISTIMIISITHITSLIWLFIIIAVSLNLVWIYGWINTYQFLKNKSLNNYK